jgi:hypothetical protein
MFITILIFFHQTFSDFSRGENWGEWVLGLFIFPEQGPPTKGIAQYS